MRKKLSIIIPAIILILSIILGSIILINSIKNGTRMSESEYNKKINDYNKQITEVNNKKIEEFKKYGITKEYNELQEEYSKLIRLKSDLTFK